MTQPSLIGKRGGKNEAFLPYVKARDRVRSAGS
jgi:hypothetical protein